MLKTGEELLPPSSKINFLVSQLAPLLQADKVAIVSEWVQLLRLVEEHLRVKFPDTKILSIDGILQSRLRTPGLN